MSHCFIWAIENFNFIRERKPGVAIESPTFSLFDNNWVLRIDPFRANFVSLELVKQEENWLGEDNVFVDIELSMLDCDGSSLVQFKKKNVGGFESSRRWVWEKFVKRDIFELRQDEFFPEDTLTVRCLMQISDIVCLSNPVSSIQTQYARTRMRSEKKCFIWQIKDFSRLPLNQTSTVSTVVNISSPTPIWTFHFCLDALRRVEINVTRKISSCKISVLDNTGKTVMSHEGFSDFPFNGNLEKESWKFPSFITINKLLENMSLYLPMDTLTLRCECIFWMDLEGQIENGMPNSIQNFPESLNPSSALKCEKCSATKTDTAKYDSHSHGGFIHDIQCMFDEGLLSDFNLQAGTKMFRIHKNILSARSPVFKAMFTADMSEKNSDGVVISDIDVDTLERMLLFIYSDRVEENIQCEDVMKLYFAADKYAIEELKQLCRCVLVAALCISNACDILVLADLHEDQELKSTALNFIIAHDSKIIGTEIWKTFQKEHSQLTIEIFNELYIMKLKK